MELSDVLPKYRKAICEGCIYSTVKNGLYTCDMETQDIYDDENYNPACRDKIIPDIDYGEPDPDPEVPEEEESNEPVYTGPELTEPSTPEEPVETEPVEPVEPVETNEPGDSELTEPES